MSASVEFVFGKIWELEGLVVLAHTQGQNAEMQSVANDYDYDGLLFSTHCLLNILVLKLKHVGRHVASSQACRKNLSAFDTHKRAW